MGSNNSKKSNEANNNKYCDRAKQRELERACAAEARRRVAQKRLDRSNDLQGQDFCNLFENEATRYNLGAQQRSQNDPILSENPSHLEFEYDEGDKRFQENVPVHGHNCQGNCHASCRHKIFIIQRKELGGDSDYSPRTSDAIRYQTDSEISAKKSDFEEKYGSMIENILLDKKDEAQKGGNLDFSSSSDEEDLPSDDVPPSKNFRKTTKTGKDKVKTKVHEEEEIDEMLEDIDDDEEDDGLSAGVQDYSEGELDKDVVDEIQRRIEGVETDSDDDFQNAIYRYENNRDYRQQSRLVDSEDAIASAKMRRIRKDMLKSKNNDEYLKRRQGRNDDDENDEILDMETRKHNDNDRGKSYIRKSFSKNMKYVY